MANKQTKMPRYGQTGLGWLDFITSTRLPAHEPDGSRSSLFFRIGPRLPASPAGTGSGMRKLLWRKALSERDGCAGASRLGKCSLASGASHLRSKMAEMPPKRSPAIATAGERRGVDFQDEPRRLRVHPDDAGHDRADGQCRRPR